MFYSTYCFFLAVMVSSSQNRDPRVKVAHFLHLVLGIGVLVLHNFLFLIVRLVHEFCLGCKVLHNRSQLAHTLVNFQQAVKSHGLSTSLQNSSVFTSIIFLLFFLFALDVYA